MIIPCLNMTGMNSTLNTNEAGLLNGRFLMEMH